MKRLRIACYGFVDRRSGSCAKAHFLLLEEMAKRGVQIDFFGWRGFNCAEDLEVYPNFHYIDLPPSSPVDQWMEQLPPKMRALLYPFVNALFNDALHFRTIKQAMMKHDALGNYDAICFMGLYAPFDLDKTPIVSLAQGTIGSEWEMIRNNKQTIIEYCGLFLYLKLKLYYFLKNTRLPATLRYTDTILCGSQWTKDWMIGLGLDAKNIYPIPYPLELDRFSPRSNNPAPNQEKVLLSLGRLDPRKRLDLLLDAFALVVQERTDVRLKIVGGFNYVPGYRRMIDQFPFPDKLEYQSSVPPAAAHQLLQSCDLLVQPSEGENFGSSVAEAAACGLPVVIGPTNGTQDYLTDAAFLFEDYTPESLKQAIITALDALDQDAAAVRSRMRAAAEKHFHVVDVVDTFVSVIAQATAHSKSQVTPLLTSGRQG